MHDTDITQQKSIKLFTVGFSNKIEGQFFRILQRAGIKKMLQAITGVIEL